MTNKTPTTKGTLFIVATPIGNKNDITLRALKTLEQVDCILAEDTRHSKPFLNLYGIKKPLISFHAHNENKKSEYILQRLENGENLALISDAGTPLISDPGFSLVRMLRENNINVVPIPGASALITALSAAGISCDIFTFAGFLPHKQSQRKEKLKNLSNITHTLLFYESSHRILEALKDIDNIFNNAKIMLVKELTKTYETFICANSLQIQNWLQEDQNRLKGEFVLIIAPRKIKEQPSNKILEILLEDLSVKQAVKIAQKLTGINKNELYKTALDIEKSINPCQNN